MAEHIHHRDFDSAFRAQFAGRAERAGGNHQSDDARRPGARGRHFGGRRDGGDRKCPPANGPGQAAGAGHPGWRAGNCPARFCFHALHLHRLCADVFSNWRGAVPFRSAG